MVFGDALKSPYRFAAAAMCVVAGASHLPVIEDHLHEAPYVGVLFIMLAVACVVEAIVLLRVDSPRVWWAAAANCSSAVAAYVWSRTVGLPQITDDIGNWTEPLAFVAIASEVLVLAFTVAALVSRHRSGQPSAVRSRAQVVLAAAVLVGGLGWTGIAAANTPGTNADMPGMTMSGMDTTQGSDYWKRVGGAFHSDGKTRTYYVGADLVAWDYAPDGRNDITGKPFDDGANTGGMRMDVVSLLPATMVVADMVPDNPGIWLFHCHVNDHIAAGMLSRYAVAN